jgi:hypothetical protein
MATRTRKPKTRTEKILAWWDRHRATTLAKWPVVAIGFLAMYVSYGHIVYVTRANIDQAHNMPGVPYLMPLIIDAMIVACARYAKMSPTATGKALAMFGFTTSMAASLAANMLASSPGFWAHAVSTLPAVAILSVTLVAEFAAHKALSPAAIARRHRDRVARRAARRGEYTAAAAPVVTATRGTRSTVVTPSPLARVNANARNEDWQAFRARVAEAGA